MQSRLKFPLAFTLALVVVSLGLGVGSAKNFQSDVLQKGAVVMEKPSKKESNSNNPTYKKPSDEEIKKSLTPEQYNVTQKEGTEPPFKNAYWNHKEAGIYVDIVSGEPLFSSLKKYDSGTGWPSFSEPLENENIQVKIDQRFGMERKEVRSKHADSHLGHVFDDGPGPKHERYCMNSSSLKFIPVNELEKSGYGKYLSLFEGENHNKSKTDSTILAKTSEIATLAGGCFWGVEELFRNLPGVIETSVGYTGGITKNPNYDEVKKGITGHAESVQIKFDPSKISYEEIITYFFKLHDPTTLNRQGNDQGSQYRSVIFYQTEEQKKLAEKVIEKVQNSGKWKGKVVTELVPAKTFYAAEEEHQKYLKRHPDGYTCHYVRNLKFD